MESGGTGFQPVKELSIYRRNLPHWERPESVYFITFRTFKQVILTEDSRDIIFISILFHHNKKYIKAQARCLCHQVNKFDKETHPCTPPRRGILKEVLVYVEYWVA